MRTGTGRVVTMTVAATLAMSLCAVGGRAAAGAGGLSVTETWSSLINPSPNARNVVGYSSPMLVTLGGRRAVMVGDRSGHLHALGLDAGNELPGWPQTVGVGVDAPISTDGTRVFAGVGTTYNAGLGGYAAYNANGSRAWWTNAWKTPTDHSSSGARSGLAVGTLQGTVGVSSGSMYEYQYALNAANGSVLPGWPYLNTDTDLTTPALADMYGNGHNDVVTGAAQTGNPPLGVPQGGRVRILSDTGRQLCVYNTNQEVDSSPAVGKFLTGGAPGIAVGTGSYFSGASQTNDLLAFNNRCGLVWSDRLDGLTMSSPAIINEFNNGALQILEGTYNESSNSGSVYLVNGSNGSVVWRTAVGKIYTGVVTADLGAGYQDIIVSSGSGAKILDGRSGAVLWSYSGLLFINAPLVTDDSNGRVGLTFAGFNNAGSHVVHFEVANSPGSRVGEPGSWPMFHHDNKLTGNAGIPMGPYQNTGTGAGCWSSSAVGVAAVLTNKPGYYTVNSNGGVCAFGSAIYHGSVSSSTVVGMAARADSSGYWVVSSNGSVHTLGTAHYYGGLQNIRLNKPIIAIAVTSDARGYYLFASDGGVFEFGDAHFFGSTGNIRLARPAVAMATSANDGGYWITTAAGVVYRFGNARYFGGLGSIRLNKPVVGIAASSDYRGYTQVASDGGVFEFGDAPYYGSLGSHPPPSPVNDLSPSPANNGYYLVNWTGQVWAFGPGAKWFGNA